MWMKAIVITSGILISEAIWQMYNAYKRSRRKAVSDGKARHKRKIFEVMFFSKESARCRPHIDLNAPCGRKDCAVEHLRKLVQYLDSATETLDVCMYFFTCPLLATAIVRAHKRGVLVRMVVDESMARNGDSQATKRFYHNGIKPKMKQLDTLMHHKFAIIDKALLITGSVNWTMSAFFGNFESLFVTNEQAAVMPFGRESERQEREGGLSLSAGPGIQGSSS
ncbi:hypothetical protein DMN91_004762 [Ooceraea biroi]|uniref:Mitochondrial cardiolipin hydrolase n=1 Tax=Ooceraea biroi TaxID=2015173 RepID=A0A3L8DPY7_OOCBI|nr:hypothetical protein DMN91_004762 [Ooceraea biroi]